MKKVLSILIAVCIFLNVLFVNVFAYDNSLINVDLDPYGQMFFISKNPFGAVVNALLAIAEALGRGATYEEEKRPDEIGEAVDGTISICLSSEPDTLDPALNSSLDGATMLVHLFSGLAKWEKDGITIVPDCAVSLPDCVENPDGTVTYEYTIRDDCYWSDGAKLTAHDFEYAWKRAASDELWADYGYMFDVIKGYPDNLAVKAVDDKKLSVTLVNRVPYWNELLAFPTFLPVREDVVSNHAWATDPDTFICNGPYKISEWSHGFSILLEKNAYYHEAETITMPKINFRLSDDIDWIYRSFESGYLKMIDFVPADKFETLKESDEFYTVSQLGTYYNCWNVNVDLLPKSNTLTGEAREQANAEIRQALSLLIDREYIVDAITQRGEIAANSFVPIGLTDADGSQFKDNATKYFDLYNVNANWEKAVEILKKYYPYDEAHGKFTDTPELKYVYNTDTIHGAIAEYTQAAFASVGFGVKLENVEWNLFLRKRNIGEFEIARHGWVADYNDPITFLDMWVTKSGNNDAQFGRGAHKNVKAYSLDLTELGYDIKVDKGTWSETYDVLIKTIKQCTDKNTRYKLMHMAEDMLMNTGCIMPIYYYTDTYMVDDSLKGVYTNPLGYKYFMYSYTAE